MYCGRVAFKRSLSSSRVQVGLQTTSMYGNKIHVASIALRWEIGESTAVI